MTAAVEASSIRAPDDPVTIHYSTAPVPRALQLPSTTFLSHGRLSLAPPPPARADANGPRGPAQALGRTTRCPAARHSSRPRKSFNSNHNKTLLLTKHCFQLLRHSQRARGLRSSQLSLVGCSRISEVFYSNMSSAQFSPLNQALTWSLEDELLSRDQLGLVEVSACAPSNKRQHHVEIRRTRKVGADSGSHK